MVQENSKSIVENAQSQVRELLEQAAKEAAEAIVHAKELGQKQGHEQAEQLKVKLGRLKELMEEELQKGMVLAALQVAQDILREELAASPKMVVDVAQTALKSVSEASRVWLRAHPEDVAILQASKRQLIDVLGKATDIDIRSDRQVERGGVLIHTESGVVDAQPKTQLEELERLLTT